MLFRSARVPLGWAGRIGLVITLVKALATWGLDVTGMAGHCARRLQHAMVKAVSGGAVPRRAPEVVLALAAPHKFLNPTLGTIRRVVATWAKRVQADQGLAEWIAPAWAGAVNARKVGAPTKGPIALLVSSVAALGWEPRAPLTWDAPWGSVSVSKIGRAHV